ncbi:MAG: septation regulator SpoVG [Oligoflexia bacterium]|nr:septation regulator SpoVG [Oligoflexia bacterium]
MEITEVKVFAVNEERLKAYVTITIDGCFVIRDLKVINGNNGLFVAMPSKKRKDGQFKDICHPLNNETREKIENKIFEVYEEELKKMGQTLEQMTIAKTSGNKYDESDDDPRN